MRNWIICFALCALIFPRAVKCEEPLRRGLFVTVIEEPLVLSSREEISKLIDFAKKSRVNMLFVQVYRENKAWFPSEIADSTPYQACRESVSEDPLQLLIKLAHARGIEVHAWFNTLSLGINKDSVFLKKYGAGILTRNLKEKNTLEDYKIDSQYFLEPGDLRIREELRGIVREILRAYPELDGIQFDYIRYPDKNPAYGYTEMNTRRFKEASGLKSIEEDSQVWKNWKRAQVTEALECFVKEARSLRPDIQVSTTGCMPYVRAYYEAFQDWPSWLEGKLVDFVTIMDYSPDPAEFESWVLDIKNRVGDFKKLNIGIGAYKLVNSPAKFKQEFCFGERAGAGACIIFHYGSLLKNPELADLLISKPERRPPQAQ